MKLKFKDVRIGSKFKVGSILWIKIPLLIDGLGNLVNAFALHDYPNFDFVYNGTVYPVREGLTIFFDQDIEVLLA
ncbi:MAG: hypothetical protein Q7S43_04530 [bacterium]|nr:hypothetical protein [bacterium]